MRQSAHRVQLVKRLGEQFIRADACTVIEDPRSDHDLVGLGEVARIIECDTGIAAFDTRREVEGGQQENRQ